MPRLWAITPPSGLLIADTVALWCQAGAAADVGLWLRTPGESPTRTLERCAGLVGRARAAGIAIVLGAPIAAIEEAAAVVRAWGLQGVVVRAEPTAAALGQARACLGPEAWLGRSTHAAAEDHDRCTMTVLGPIYAPRTPKPVATAALGLEALALAAMAPGARIIAVGGVDRAHANACVASGAWGLAGIRSFFGDAEQVVEDVGALRLALQLANHGPTSP